MPVLQRRISIRGPRFWSEGGRLLFVEHLDGSTRIGPREATAADKAAHAEAWAAFQAGEPPAPLAPQVAFADPPDHPKRRPR